MIEIAREKLGAPPALTRAYAEILGGLGLGSLYARGGRDRPLELGPFEGNPITSDAERYKRNRLVLEAAPALGLGSPTIAWLRAALRSIAKLTAPDYPLRVEVPLLLFAAGKDTIVSTRAIEEFALRLKVGTHVLIRSRCTRFYRRPTRSGSASGRRSTPISASTPRQRRSLGWLPQACATPTATRIAATATVSTVIPPTADASHRPSRNSSRSDAHITLPRPGNPRSGGRPGRCRSSL